MPKRVCIVVSSFPTISETFILNQIKFLIDSGYKVRILSTRDVDTLIGRHPVVEDYHLMDYANTIDWEKHMPLNFLQRILGALKELYKYRQTPLFSNLLKSFNVLKYGRQAVNLVKFYQTLMAKFFIDGDIIHVHFALNALPIIPLLDMINPDVRLLVTFHGYDAFHYSKQFYTPLLSSNIVSYTVNTPFLKEKVENLSFPKERVSILPVGLDTSQFNRGLRCGEVKGVFNVIFIGRLIPLKAPLLAIKIIQRLQQLRNNCHLTIIGEGPEFTACQEHIVYHNLQNIVSMKGSMTQDQVKKELSESHVFLFPGIIDGEGRSEAQGLVIQEAQAMELPVIVSDVGGMKYGMINGETGFVVKEKDIEGFVEKLKWLMDHPEEQQKMGKAARNFVVENYDNKVLGEKLIEIYES
ncbi:glycosyltransferase [Algivirga pacifica]|uniref:Colanic acid biosynthesis glycosyltransferase WcaL n=1 Tax=Algivirga pacifica TaxID=1162670 RepID=A0ABP9DLV2_9BACT